MATTDTATILQAEAAAARRPCPRPAKVVMPGDAGDCSVNEIPIELADFPPLDAIPNVSC